MESMAFYRELTQHDYDAFLPGLAGGYEKLGVANIGLHQYVEAARLFDKGLRLVLPYIEGHLVLPPMRAAFHL
jgi:hypothetical protein